MINTDPIDFISIEEVSKNIDFYKNIFINNGILVFRDANLSHEKHVELHNVLRDSFGWYSYLNNSYTEDHNRLTSDNLTNVTDNNKVILNWHVEHPSYSNPIIAATWNMHKFTTNPENGKTYFVDTEKIFISLPEKYKEFSKKCSLSHNKITHDLIGYHWISNNPVIRLSNISPYSKLELFDKRKPTKDEIKTYEEMMNFIQEQILYNLDIRIVHKWKQGDIVMPDMYKMCHAVSGGFDSKDRQFTGIWGYRYNDFKELEGRYV